MTLAIVIIIRFTDQRTLEITLAEAITTYAL